MTDQSTGQLPLRDVASPLANPRATREVLERFGFVTKHRLGQNFLVDDAVVRHILQLAELTLQDKVLEVGPGIGTLTLALLAHTHEVLALEADLSLQPVLEELQLRYPNRLDIVWGDALKLIPAAVADVAPNKFVSNLPYQVAATLILQALIELPSLERFVVMVQAEVADRISAVPNTKAYGAYTAKLGLYAQVTGRFGVSHASFMPAPHVESAVVRIERRAVPTNCELSYVADVIDAAFAQRRKTIRNSMAARGFEKAVLDQAFERAGIEGSRRAETLSVEDFIGLAEAIQEASQA